MLGTCVAGLLVWWLVDIDGRLNRTLFGSEGEVLDSTEIEGAFPSDPLKYGLDLTGCETLTGQVKRNEFLHDILSPYGIGPVELDVMGRGLKDTFDVRKMRAGHPYTLVFDHDPDRRLRFFVYEISRTDYVVYSFDSVITAHKDKKPVRVETRQTAGTIHSSLYLTLDQQGASPELAIKLSEVYAWAVDFYRIQKGDWFRVIYDEQFVDSQSVGISHIKGAVFNHYGHDYYAVWFEAHGQEGDYFDQDNRACRSTFLKAPVRFTRISSRYTLSRKHPKTGVVKPHFGTDYAAPYGTPIVSTANGTVSEATHSKYNGNYVKVRHNSTYSTQYLHMQKIASGIRPGVRVQQGQVIGYVGSTGLATGPHVCYRFWVNGRQLDALKVELPPAEPVKAEYLDAYEAVKREMMERLQQIPVPGREEVALTK
jgi:murein DD-endopeptidase MepM/ murein hydrolase activator NlpD